MTQANDEFSSEVLSETENFIIWKHEDDDEVMFHVELGGITLHMSGDEWDEFVVLMKGVA